MSPRLSISDIFLRAQPDDRLARLATEGNERAFSVLAERHRKALVAHAARIVGHGSAEDVAQQALLRAWSALRRGAVVEQPGAWLSRIVHNQALTELGRTGAPTEPLAEGLADERGATASFELRQEARSVLAGISALPERQRIALVATEFEGRSRTQIASDLGMSDGAVRQLVHRARAGVRAAVAAVVPWPLLLRIVRHEPDGALAHPATASALAGGGGAAGAAGVAVKLGAAVLAVGALGGGVIAHLAHRGRAPAHHLRVVRARDALASGTSVASTAPAGGPSGTVFGSFAPGAGADGSSNAKGNARTAGGAGGEAANRGDGSSGSRGGDGGGSGDGTASGSSDGGGSSSSDGGRSGGGGSDSRGGSGAGGGGGSDAGGGAGSSSSGGGSDSRSGGSDSSGGGSSSTSGGGSIASGGGSDSSGGGTAVSSGGGGSSATVGSGSISTGGGSSSSGGGGSSSSLSDGGGSSSSDGGGSSSSGGSTSTAGTTATASSASGD